MSQSHRSQPPPSIHPSARPQVRGTRVILHLKEDAAELSDPIRLARLIKQYSQFIQFPIKLYSATKEPKQVGYNLSVGRLAVGGWWGKGDRRVAVSAL